MSTATYPGGMTQRITLTLPDDAAEILRAQRNASAHVAKLIRAHALTESARQYARWLSERPGYAEDMVAENEATIAS